MLIAPLPEHLQALRRQVRAFMDERVIPVEDALVQEDRQDRSDTLRRLQAEARAAGLWAPHMPEEYGGRGLGVLGMCTLFREMGRSLVGAKVFQCDAPDQGNMQLLLETGTEEQKRRWLRPLVDGEIGSSFCMTEPAPGAGADPSNLRTTATLTADGWRLDGRKWYATGGGKAALLLVMARTGPDAATMFLTERTAPGVRHVRDVQGLGEDLLDHREAEFVFEGAPGEPLGPVGDGFRLAQQRLVPARLTHCMRWLGLADRTLQLCRAYAGARRSFGRTLAEHGAVARMFAEGASAIHAGNLMTFHCAGMLEQGLAREARPYSSIVKNHVARLLCRILDDAIQMHGALGYSHDMPFAGWYTHARAARIADGPDEVHEMLIARDFLKGRLEVLL